MSMAFLRRRVPPDGKTLATAMPRRGVTLWHQDAGQDFEEPPVSGISSWRPATWDADLPEFKRVRQGISP